MDSSDSNTDSLRAYLASRDCPCPGCGYNLRGLATSRCPECSQHLRLSVALFEPGLGRFLAVLLPPAIVGGAFTMGLMVVLISSLSNGRFLHGEEGRALIWYPLVIGCVYSALAIRVVRPRPRNWLRSRSRAASLLLAAASIVGSLGAVAFWTVWVVWFD